MAWPLTLRLLRLCLARYTLNMNIKYAIKTMQEGVSKFVGVFEREDWCILSLVTRE